MAKNGLLGAIAGMALGALARATRSARKTATGKHGGRAAAERPGDASRPIPSRTGTAPASRREEGESAAGQSGMSRTIEVDPRAVTGIRLEYAPDRDGDPDAGEIIWTWVPYAENDGRGKDRPVLVVARQDAARVYAVKLTSKSHDGDREFLSIGTGPWDGQGRESWVDLDQLYSVHEDGMRREAASLDVERFARVADRLSRRYGWSV